MTHIARYIDDPPQIFLWDIDDIILFSVFFGAEILTGLIWTGSPSYSIPPRRKSTRASRRSSHGADR